MKLMNLMLGFLAATVALSSAADTAPSTPGTSNGGIGPSNPFPLYLGYVVDDMGSVLGGTEAAARAIGNNGRAVGEVTSCIGRGCVPKPSAVYWDAGQAAVKIPSLQGMTLSTATGITDAGIIVGYSIDSGGHSHGWRWSADAGTTEVTAPDGSSLIFTAAADNGWTTGYHFPPGKLARHAFRYNLMSGYFDDQSLFPVCVRTLLESLGLIGQVDTGGSTGCLNDKDLVATQGNSVDVLGNVAGSLKVGNGQYKYGYFWPNGFDPIDLHALNSSIDVQDATAANGYLVLGPYTAWDGYSVRTYSWSGDNGSIGDMGLSDNTYPNALNSNWRMVGRTTTGTQRPFTWYLNKLTYLAVPSGQNNADALGLNRCGTIVGYAMDASNRKHALRWTKTNCD